MFKILSSGSCKHLYIDFGTNIGMQIRKLYEPLKFPGNKIEQHYKYYFGDDRNSVCSIGFEANSLHTERLQKVENYYTYLNFSCVIFTDSVVHTHLAPVTFYRDDRSPEDKHEWGASILIPSGKNSTIIGVDTNNFIHEIYNIWKLSSNYDRTTSKIFAKMDIEGSEFQVLPTMLTRGSLCLISGMSVEWHFALNKNAPRNFDDILYFITSNSYDCDFWVFNEDDETYMNNEEPIPDFPSRMLQLYSNFIFSVRRFLLTPSSKIQQTIFLAKKID